MRQAGHGGQGRPADGLADGKGGEDGGRLAGRVRRAMSRLSIWQVGRGDGKRFGRWASATADPVAGERCRVGAAGAAPTDIHGAYRFPSLEHEEGGQTVGAFDSPGIHGKKRFGPSEVALGSTRQRRIGLSRRTFRIARDQRR